MDKRIAIFGAGISGMLVAQCARFVGVPLENISIFSAPRGWSKMFGTQYLHRDIPGLILGDPRTVKYELRGSAEDYRKKVYGDEWNGTVSPEEFEGEHQAWDIREAYMQMTSFYASRVFDWVFDRAGMLQNYDKFMDKFDHVFCTIPRKAVCLDPRHMFISQEVWASGDAPDWNNWCPIDCPDDTIICDGTRDVSWYRTSHVFKHKTAEWPIWRKPPYENVARVSKPVMTDCTCWPDWVFSGRYGVWTKGELAHHSFERAARVIRGLEL